MKKLYRLIGELVEYGVKCELIPESERIYSINLLIDIFGEDSYEPQPFENELLKNAGDVLEEKDRGAVLEDILKGLLDIAVGKGLVEDNTTAKDLFDTRLMNTITPRPSAVCEKYQRLFLDEPSKATDWFYRFCKDTDYIRRYRAVKDIKWEYCSDDYGMVDITINLAKPEKDPKAIAAAAKAGGGSYPMCQLCVENMGYAGRMNHPARQTHRIMPITINGNDWGFQYSPYGYYNEHCILLNGKHVPMSINEDTFRKMFDFIRQYPHYMIGSNADLPIVGGSILAHDHYQGGKYEFAMAKAGIIRTFKVEGYDDVDAGIVKWPMSVIRLSSADYSELIGLSTHILDKWRSYTDEEAYIFSNTEGIPHNTITPIARKKGDMYEIDLVLRNNITTDEHPMGLYHPHAEYHNIKKENIGLIEVMGLAILPSRLVKELDAVAKALVSGEDMSNNPLTTAHAAWADGFKGNYSDINSDNVMDIIHDEVGKTFIHVLEDAGVYKCTPEGMEAFMRFVNSL